MKPYTIIVSTCMCRPLRTDLVETLIPIDNPCSFNFESSQGFGERQTQISGMDANNHEIRPGRIQQWPQNIEDGRMAQLSPNGSNKGKSRMAEGCKKVQERIGEGRCDARYSG